MDHVTGKLPTEPVKTMRIGTVYALNKDVLQALTQGCTTSPASTFGAVSQN